jgi:hypothetical protein
MEMVLKHLAVLQVAMAVVNTAEHEETSSLQELQSTEKVCYKLFTANFQFGLFIF